MYNIRQEEVVSGKRVLLMESYKPRGKSRLLERFKDVCREISRRAQPWRCLELVGRGGLVVVVVMTLHSVLG